MGLYDMVLIKDNHVDSAGSVTAAVQRVRRKWGTRFPIEVECRTSAEVDRGPRGGRRTSIMLDNMDAEDMRGEVRRIGGRVKVEASGNMTPGADRRR